MVNGESKMMDLAATLSSLAEKTRHARIPRTPANILLLLTILISTNLYLTPLLEPLASSRAQSCTLGLPGCPLSKCSDSPTASMGFQQFRQAAASRVKSPLRSPSQTITLFIRLLQKHQQGAVLHPRLPLALETADGNRNPISGCHPFDL